MNEEETYALLQSWGKVMGFRTLSQSKYMVWENQRAIRMKCYPDGTYKGQPPSCLTVFVTHEELSFLFLGRVDSIFISTNVVFRSFPSFLRFLQYTTCRV